MRMLSLELAADYLEAATIEQTVNEGHAIVHFGMSYAGNRFVLVNNCMGETVLTESM